MKRKYSRIRAGATRQGKTQAAARSIVLESDDEVAVVLDPHERSLAETVLTHASGEILFARLSDVQHSIGFELLAPSSSGDPVIRRVEDRLRADAFVEILLRRRGADSAAGTPLLEEYLLAAIGCMQSQRPRKPLAWLPKLFLPQSEEFARMLRDCPLPDIRHKFSQLTKLTPRGLRAEVGSVSRLVNGVFSPAFEAWSRGGFDLGAYLQRPRAKLIVERGRDIGEDTNRVIMGAIILLVMDHARRRKEPYPVIRVTVDEATNAGLVGRAEQKGIAELSKYGLVFDFLMQTLDVPGGSDAMLQNCLEHQFFGCANYETARRAATDVLAGLTISGEESRAEKLAWLTSDIMNLAPGWRWLRDPSGSRKEYVPMLRSPYPPWPGLAEAKMKEKLECLYRRPEYRPSSGGEDETPPSTTSSPNTPPPPNSSGGSSSSPADRWRRRGSDAAGGS